MKTKQEQRAEILDFLGRAEKLQKEDGRLPAYLLWKNIRAAMEMKPEAVVANYFVGANDSIGASSREVYSKADNKKVATVINRMEEQGYINVSGRWFKVLKTK